MSGALPGQCFSFKTTTKNEFAYGNGNWGKGKKRGKYKKAQDKWQKNKNNYVVMIIEGKSKE